MKISNCEICVEVNVKAWAIGICSHLICYRCSLRLRVLFQITACPLCKRSSDSVFIFGSHVEQETIPTFLLKLISISDDGSNYISFDPNNQYKIYCENEGIRRLCEELINPRCPIFSCNMIFAKRSEFPLHLERAHGKFICTICFDNQKLFLEEIPLFENSFTLRSHMRTMEEKKKRQDNASAASSMMQSQKKPIGHPECKFCSVRFYSNDELYAHCRDAHESCFICTSNGVKDQYYKNYESLERHFQDSHFMCNEKSCLETKFVIFSTVIDLRGHMANQHPELYKGGQRSQNRHLLSIDLFKKDPPSSSRQEPIGEVKEDISTPFVLSENSFPSLAPITSSMSSISRKKPAEPPSREKLFPSLSTLKPSAILSPALTSVPQRPFSIRAPLSKPSISSSNQTLQKSASTQKQETRAETFPELPKREGSTAATPIHTGPPPGLSFPKKSERGKLRILRLP